MLQFFWEAAALIFVVTSTTCHGRQKVDGFLTEKNLRVPLIDSKLGELVSSLLFPPGPVTSKLFVLSLCQSLHLLSD